MATKTERRGTLTLFCADCGRYQSFRGTTSEIIRQIDAAGWHDSPRPEDVRCKRCSELFDDSRLGCEE